MSGAVPLMLSTEKSGGCGLWAHMCWVCMLSVVCLVGTRVLSVYVESHVACGHMCVGCAC